MRKGIIIAAAITVLAFASVSYAGIIKRVSVNSNGREANRSSYYPSISADGRHVAFSSYATNLVPGDTNYTYDIFVHDNETGLTERVSVDSSGGQARGRSDYPSISADGRYVAFLSYAYNLVPNDTNNRPDIFVHDRETGVTERVSVDSQGNQANEMSYYYPSISADGRYVAFLSFASNLVPGDTNGSWDIFLHDRQTGVTELVSVDSQGNQAKSSSLYFTSMSGDGRYVAFMSYANNLVPGDSNNSPDIFVHDMVTGLTERVSVDSQGNQANYSSQYFSISSNGRYVTFVSYASNLVADDTNRRPDIFVHDRVTGLTERVNVDSQGNQADEGSYFTSISGDGRFVVFYSFARNLVPNDTNGSADVFVHDRKKGKTERLSVGNYGWQGNYSSYYPTISRNGRYVAFYSFARNLVPNDTNGSEDVFVHDRGPQNSPPVADPGADHTASCSGPGGARVALDGSASTDPDGDTLSYTWSGPFGTVTGVNPTVTIPMGTYPVSLTVDDGNGGKDTDSVLITVSDTTAPSTTVALNGITGSNGWYTSAVGISLSASDLCSDVAELRYSLDGSSNAVAGAAASFTLLDGIHTLSFHAVDSEGNVESITEVTLKVDRYAPVVTILGVTDGAQYESGSVPVPSYSATDSTSGVAAAGDSLTSEEGVCSTSFTYSVTAADAAGNLSNANATYQVNVTAGSLMEMVAGYVDSGQIARQMATPLKTKVKKVLKAKNTTAMHGTLRAFMNQVRAQSGKKIDRNAAAKLIETARCLDNK